MKKIINYSGWAFAFLCLIFSNQTLKAQEQVDIFLEAGIEDAEKLLQNYINPFVKGFGYGINNGWNHTAKPHKTLGFDLMVTVNAARVPSKHEFFTFVNSDYTYVELSDASNNQLPTVFGPSQEGPELRFLDENQNEIVRITSPQGLGLKEEIGHNIVPTPMVQLGLGLFKGTDLKLRFVPKIDFGDGDFNLFGIGIMHDVKQHIPGIKLLPFDLSFFGGYTSMRTNVVMSEAEQQSGIYEVNGLTLQGLISKKISVLTLYGGAGFNHVSSNMRVLGEFQLEDNTTLVDPIDLAYKFSSPSFTAGFSLKLAVLALKVDYTVNEFSMLSAGIGFTVR